MVVNPGDENRVLTVPNALSMLRLVLVPVFLVALAQGELVVALVVLAVSAVTDFLDGYIARRLGQVTRLGALLDPAADRLYIAAALVGLGILGLVPVWLIFSVILRDVVLLVIAIILLRSCGRTTLPVVRTGKVATAVLLVSFPVIVLGQVAFDPAGPVTVIGLAVAIFGAALYWVAGIIYIVQTRMLIRRLSGNGEQPSDTLDM